jgi:cardiolipin synthase
VIPTEYPLLLVIHLLLAVVAIALLLRHQRPPVSAVAWLMSIVFLPILGAILFWFFGMNRVKRRQRAWWKQRRRRDRRRADATAGDCHPAGFNRLQQRLAELTRNATGAGITCGNQVRLLPDSAEAFDAMEQAIRQARHSVHVQYYIYRPDKIGTRIRDALIAKAREGVRVRFMYDGIGSWGLGRRFLRAMLDAGIEVCAFLPGRSLRDRWSVNLRNHRKLVIVDDRIAFTGGLNVGDEYLGRNPAWGYWRDTQLALAGPVVKQLIDVFNEDWFCATDCELDPLPEEVDLPGRAGNVHAQVIADGPDLDVRPLRMVLQSAILEAERNITLSTGYFVPTQPLQEALCTAAARGVKVRILVAGPSTYWYTLWAGRSYYAELLALGAEIYEYRKGLFHAKVLTVDGCWSLVGTPNFDVRSLDLNFEVAVSFSDETIARDLQRQFEEDVRHSLCIVPERWARRSTWRIRAENFCRLFGPLL